MALAPWNVLAGGKIRTDEEEERRRQSGEKGRTFGGPNWERDDKEKAVCKALERVAAEIGAKHITSGWSSRFVPIEYKFNDAAPASSCHCVPNAEDALRLPHYRRA